MQGRNLLQQRLQIRLCHQRPCSIDLRIIIVMNLDIDARAAFCYMDQITVDTRFCGTRQDPSVRGSIFGIGESNFTPAALLSGVMNGIASELYDMAGPVCRDVASGKRGLVGSGNGIRKNPAMSGVLERKFGAKLTVPAYPEEAAYGASRLCGYVS